MQDLTTKATRTTSGAATVVTVKRQKHRSYTVGLIIESNDFDKVYKKRLKEAIIYQIGQKTGHPDVKVEFVEAILDKKVLEALDPDNYNRSTWMAAEQALQCVANYLAYKRADTMVIVSESLIMYQPRIALLGVLPCTTPDFTDELNSFATDIFSQLSKAKNEGVSTGCLDPCVSIGLLGNEKSVALLSDRLSVLPDYSEVRKKYSSVFIRWCVLPKGVRVDLMKRLNGREFNKNIMIHHWWMLDLIERLPRLYAKRKVASKNIAPPKIHTIIAADTKTEMLLLGLTEKQYREAASRPGEIYQLLSALPDEAQKWPDCMVTTGKIRLVGAVDIYAKAIAEAVCS